ncbi:MAG: Gfo/Idh/MocA family oxidoreductase [Saprospiraceae bacterium]
MKKLKLIVIGCGSHSLENIIPSLAAIPYVEIITICDNNEIALSKVKNWFPDANFLNKENYEKEDFCGHDAVIVAGTPQLHTDISGKCLEMGIPIFVEKPPSVTTNELEMMAKLASENKVVTCVGHNLRHSNGAIEFQKLLQSKGFGKPIAMEMRYMASKPRGVRWGLNSPIRSFLLSHANHAIDLMIYQMGRIKKTVAARAWPDVQGGVAITVQFIFESGAIGNLLASSYAPYFTVDLSVLSDTGSLAKMNGLREVILTGGEEQNKRWHKQWTARTLETGFHYAGYQTELEAFFNAIESSTNNLHLVHPSFQDEVEIYHAMDAIEKSINDNQ